MSSSIVPVAVDTPPAAAVAVDYESLLFSKDNALAAAGSASLNSTDYYMVQEFVPPPWCAALTVAVAVQRLKELCLYCLRKEAEALKEESTNDRIFGADADGELKKSSYYRGQSILARAAKRWLSDLA